MARELDDVVSQLEGMRRTGPIQQDSAYKPARLRLCLGHSEDDVNEIELTRAGWLTWKFWTSPYDFSAGVETSDPPRHAWLRFAEALTACAIWGWNAEYRGPGPYGPAWNVDIQWGDRTVVSAGRDAFPDSFDAFAEAVSALVEGTGFSRARPMRRR